MCHSDKQPLFAKRVKRRQHNRSIQVGPFARLPTLVESVRRREATRRRVIPNTQFNLLGTRQQRMRRIDDGLSFLRSTQAYGPPTILQTKEYPRRANVLSIGIPFVEHKNLDSSTRGL